MIAPIFELLKYSYSITHCCALFAILVHVVASGASGKRREELITEGNEFPILDSDLDVGVNKGWRKDSRVIPEALMQERKQGQL